GSNLVVQFLYSSVPCGTGENDFLLSFPIPPFPPQTHR
ncbi:hypothetical protein OWV82_012860, partial [Melia azedarach]